LFLTRRGRRVHRFYNFQHFTELGFAKVPFEVSNSWFSGACEVTAHKFEEMLGTKFKAVFGPEDIAALQKDKVFPVRAHNGFFRLWYNPPMGSIKILIAEDRSLKFLS